VGGLGLRAKIGDTAQLIVDGPASEQPLCSKGVVWTITGYGPNKLTWALIRHSLQEIPHYAAGVFQPFLVERHVCVTNTA
jgi:hypothetical protein